MKLPSVLGIVSYKVFPAQMGGQKCVADFYSHLALKTRVVLAVSKDNETDASGLCKVFPFLYNHHRGFANIFYVFRLQKLIRQEQIDIICIEHSYFGWLGILLRRLTKKPYIIRSHNIEAQRFRDMRKDWWLLYQWYEKWVHRSADHSFFITNDEMSWAIRNWQLDEKKCTVVTYGTDIRQPITTNEKAASREQLIIQNNLNPTTRLFLFNGSFDYLPNTDALRVIINELLPVLNNLAIDYRILICGRGMTESWQKVLQSHPELIYKDFVADVSLYYKGADCFINPVTLGSGIKIKLIDALANNLTVISARNGSRGVDGEVIGKKLIVLDDYDWQSFAQTMADSELTEPVDTPASFYRQFNWDTIVQKALLSLQSL